MSRRLPRLAAVAVAGLTLAAGLALLLPLDLAAAEPSWEGKTVLLTRPGVQLQAPEGKGIAPKTAGVAKDLMFQVKKEEKDRVLLDSRRQNGWAAKADAVLFDQADEHFTKELARDPKNVHALTARGVVRGTLLRAGTDSDGAVADFDRAIELDAKATLAYYHRANVAYGKGRYDQALADYNAVIEQDPGFDWAYHVRGWIYYRRQDYDRALADYQTAIKLVPTETVFYRDRGNIALARKKYDDALADYTKSIELDPAYLVPWHLRGRTWEAKKEYARARADYEKAVELAGKPGLAGYHTSLAVLLAACPDATVRDGKKALEAARRAYGLAKGPTELVAMAAAHAELGEFDQAVEWQEKAIAVAPNKTLSDQYRERLKLYQDKKPYRLE